MAEAFGVGAGLVGVIGLAIQITQVVVNFGLEWKDAPDDVKTFLAELQTLKTTLSETNTNIILNQDFVKAFQNQPSVLLSQLGSNASPTTDTKLMLQICEKELKNLLRELERRVKGHRVGWERIKGAFLAKNTRESVENLHRQCQALNSMVSIDTAVLGAITYKEVKETRKEYQETRVEQQEARKEQQEWQQSDASQKILMWLTSNDYSAQQSDFLTRRQEGTGQWLLDSPEFQNWCNGNRQTLFCPGMPGAGKTIMASIVVDHLCTIYRSDNSIGIAYLYCNFRRQDEQKPVDLLASLLKQFIQALRSIPESVKSLYERYKDKQARPSFDEISKELYSVVAGYSKSFIIIDALDECRVSEGGRTKILLELFNLQARVGASLLATSRFIPDITREFAGKSASLEIRASDKDVRKYLDGHIIRLPSFVSRSLDLQAEIKNEIMKAVKGMFLLAQLYLDSLIGTRSMKALRTALQTLPKGSDAYDYAYSKAMDRIEGQIANSRDLAKQALSWITCAKRPLTTLELQHALAVEVGESELDEENLPEIEDIISVCAGLVTVDEESNIIRLVHFTTQEYFERTWKSWFPNSQNYITMICVTYLSFTDFETGFCLTDEKFEMRLRSHILYDYAARNWGHHAYAASTEVEHLILDLLESEAKVAGSSQAMMTSGSYPDYSQDVPRQMRGVHLAAYFGLREEMIALLKNGYDLNFKDTYHRTPLSWAAENGHKTVVGLLLEKGAELEPKDTTYGQTPLSWAAENGHETVVKLLLENGAKPDSKDNHCRTPLSWAARNGYEMIMKLLIEKGAELKSKDKKNGQTPLSWAARNGYEAIVKLVLDKGAELESKDNYGQTSLLLAAENGHEAVVNLLLKKGAELESKDSLGQTPLSRAAENGHETVVKLLVEKGAELKSKDNFGQTPLLWAAENGHETVVKLLLKKGAELDSKDNHGRTPLLCAARNGYEMIVKLLLKKGAELEPKDTKYGQAPLSWAAENGHETIVKLLLDKGAELESKDNRGRTPLSWASKKGHETVVKLLQSQNNLSP